MKLMTCKRCGEEFDLKPGKPGFANVCEECTGLRQAAPAIAPKAAAKVRRSKPVTFASIIRSMDRLIECVEDLDGGKQDPVLRQLRNDFVGSKFCK